MVHFLLVQIQNHWIDWFFRFGTSLEFQRSSYLVALRQSGVVISQNRALLSVAISKAAHYYKSLFRLVRVRIAIIKLATYTTLNANAYLIKISHNSTRCKENIPLFLSLQHTFFAVWNFLKHLLSEPSANPLLTSFSHRRCLSIIIVIKIVTRSLPSDSSLWAHAFVLPRIACFLFLQESNIFAVVLSRNSPKRRVCIFNRFLVIWH